MRKHLNPALVISLIALFVALGGSSYAAKVKDASLLAKDFKAGQLPQGARGENGATGARGPSDGYVGNRQASPLLTLTGSFERVAISPALPAGNYVVTARANLVNTGGIAATGIICTMGDDGVQALSMSAGSQVPLALSSGVKLGAPGTIDMNCLRSTGTVQVAQASVAAIHVESLTVETTGN